MKKLRQNLSNPVYCQTALATALLLTFGGACAQEAAPTPDELRQELYTPTSQVSVGLGYQSSDSRRFGTYRGIGDERGYGLLDLDLVKRDDSTGTWMKLRGKDLGLDSRELRFDHERQGDWSYFLQGSQMARKEPLLVNTGLDGISTANQTVSSAAVKRNVDLQVKHNIYALGVRKFMAGGFDVRVTAKQDEANGDRMWGRGTPGSMEFMTEPIDRVTRQWEVVAGYADRKMQFSGGYSGSSYENTNPILRLAGGAAGFATAPAMSAFATPPSNHAHQLHFAGGYNLSDTTRTTFKASRTVAYQNEAFDSVFTPRLAGSPASLNGKLATTLVYTDLTLRPMDRLNVTGMLRFEERDDQTPEAQYLTATASYTGKYKPRQLEQVKASVEANYQLDDGYRLIGSLEREDMKRNGPADIVKVGYRAKTDETSERVEIKRTMSETLNGGLALIHSKRGGSDFTPDTLSATTNQLSALMWADRSRNKVRMTADWIPAEKWSLQFLADYSDDTYSGRVLGPRKGKSDFFSGDLNYRVNDRWNLSTWASRENSVANQSTVVTGATPLFWDASIRDTSTAWGIAVRGKPLSNLQVGADLSSSRSVAEHDLAKVSGPAATAVNSLPGFFYRQASLKMFGDYALQRNSGVRVDVIVDRRKNNDWTWQPWTYTDGTTVTNVPSENTTFVGVSYYYRWR